MKQCLATAAALAVLLGLVAGPARGEVERWSPRGPYTAMVWDLEIDPGDSRRIFTMTPEAVIRSDDGGASWRERSLGLPEGELEFRDLAVDLRRGERVLLATASNGLFRSEDGGELWSPSSEGLTVEGLRVVVADSSTPSTFYAGGFDRAAVFRSADGGATWTELASFAGGSMSGLVVEPTDPDVLYAMPSGGPLRRSTDGGASWLAVAGAGLPETGGFRDLEVGLASPDQLFAAFRAAVFRSADGGATWTEIGPSFGPGTFVNDITLDPADPETLYVATSDEGGFKTTDGGTTWSPLGESLLSTRLSVLAVDPSDPGTVLAGSSAHGVFRSADGGLSFTASNRGFTDAPAIVDLVIDGASSDILYAATSAGLYRSEDVGKRWQLAGRDSPVSLRALAVEPAAAGVLYSAGGDPFFVNGGRILKSTDGARTWSVLFADADRPIGSLVVDPVDPRNVYAAATSRFFFRSPDAGESWSVVPVFGSLEVFSLAIDPRTPSTLYAGLRGGVWQSLDGGVTWDPAGLEGERVESVAVDPLEPDRVWAGTGRGVWFSSDRGATWERSGRFTTTVADLAIDPRRPENIYAASRTLGVLRTSDAGTTWQTLTDGPASFWVTALAIGPERPERLYAGTREGIHDVELVPPIRVLELRDGRFEVEVAWRDFDDREGSGRLVRRPGLESDDSGLFYFFDEDNWELLVKVLDGCGINGHFWVFAAATTNVAYELRVTDTASGQVQVYRNPLGVASPATTDTDAFATCDE